MNTLRLFSRESTTVPATTAWYLGDLGEARGKQELFTRQAPQRLKTLREHALIESAVSSNRIEGVTVAPGRVRELVLGHPLLRDRDEEEVRGYRDALTLIHQDAASLLVDEATVRKLHRLTRGEIGDAGKYKEKDGDIIERYPDGSERVRFRPVSAAETIERVAELVADWQRCLDERWVHPLIALAAFNLDFLCIHPFRDGNGRVSRLLLLLQCYHQGYEVGRYISLERLIEQNKARYYETLEQALSIGTKAGMTHGRTSISCCSSSSTRIGNLPSGSVTSRHHAARRLTRFLRPSNASSGSSRSTSWSRRVPVSAGT